MPGFLFCGRSEVYRFLSVFADLTQTTHYYIVKPHKDEHSAIPEPTNIMKTIVRFIIAIFTFATIAVGTEEYKTFTTSFKQSKDKEKVILELPISDLGTEGIRFPEPGTYILNKPEILKKELENQGYKVLDENNNMAINLAILALILVFIGLFLNAISIKRSFGKAL